MVKRSLPQWWLTAGFAMLAGLLVAAPASLSAARPAGDQTPLRVNLLDTGQTIALPVGQRLVVSLPLRRYDDNYWYVAENSGGGLKLITGPDTRRPPNWTPFKPSTQVFYFERVSPGTAHLVLEQSYFSKPMILKVVD